MRALVVFAHPDPNSFGASVLHSALAGLKAGGHAVDLIDLYDEDYDPNLSGSEHRNYMVVGADHPDSTVKRHIQLLDQAEALVFIYPTFWMGMPAIMKGWLDRTFLPGVAFELNPSTGKVRPALDHVQALVGITTYGSSRTYLRLVGDSGRRTLHRTVRLICGKRCKRVWISLDGLDTRPVEDREAFLVEVRQRTAGL